MIKINLLPHKKIKAVDKNILKLRAVVLGVTVLSILLAAYGTIHIYSKKSSLNTQVDLTKKQLDIMKKKVKEAEGYEKSRLEFEQKLKTIQELEKRKIPMTPLLNGINAAITRDVWLTSLSVKGPMFTMEGIARDSKKNAQAFADKLQELPTFSNIQVEDVKDVSTAKEDRYTFKISGKLAGFEDLPPEPVAATETKPGAKPAANKPAPKKK
ncbi:MAG: PilN domain-containing protein [Nitrospirota bacterium]